MKWLRLYDDLLFNAKAQSLPPKLFKHWINLICLASKNEPRGVLPGPERIAFALRMKVNRVSIVIEELSRRGFIDKGNLIHDWSSLQRESDDSAIRKQSQRMNSISANVTGHNRDKTASDTDTEQTQKQNRTDTEREFEDFWVVSTKRGSKKEAFSEWRKIKAEIRTSGEITQGMLCWMDSLQWQDETKQPHIFRWLRREGWKELVPRGGNGNGRGTGKSRREQELDRAAEEACRILEADGFNHPR